MDVNKVLKELETVVIERKDDKTSERRVQKMNYQIGEYKRQEKYLSEVIAEQHMDLIDYFSMKMAKLEVLSEMLEEVTVKIGKLEQMVQDTKIKIEKSC